jgi:hypothetical protein
MYDPLYGQETIKSSAAEKCSISLTSIGRKATVPGSLD